MHRRAFRAGVICAVCTVVPLFAGGVPAQAATTSPNPSATYNQLSGVDELSATNAWAVGDYQTTTGVLDTLILHWNGVTWTKVPSPNPSLITNRLDAVSGDSATDVWAVGDYAPGSGADSTLILHWDGSKWARVASPTAGSSVSNLYGVSAVSSTNAWASGTFRSTSGPDDTLILHWNGTKWTRVPSPDPSTTDNFLFGVSAASAGSAWSVGYDCSAACNTSPYDTMTLQWNGSGWSAASSPDPSATVNDLQGVAAISAKNAWAVGEEASVTSAYDTLVLHWNGTAWSAVASDSPSSTDNFLVGVGGASPSAVWAVGDFCEPGCSAYDSLIEAWNGTSWVSVSSPDPSSGVNDLNAVSTLSSTDAFAVGQYEAPGTVFDTFVVHWNGTDWSQV
jgi:hypothetical protein